MMTSSTDDKSDICQFFYQDLFHIVNTVQNNTIKYNTMQYKLSHKMDQSFLRYSVFFQFFHRRPTNPPHPPPTPLPHKQALRFWKNPNHGKVKLISANFSREKYTRFFFITKQVIKKRNQTKTKSMKPKLLKTLNINQF